MIQKFIMLILLLATVLSGCTTSAPSPKAGLTVSNTAEGEKWDLPNHLVERGEGNSSRVLVKGNQRENILELVAGSQGSIEYFVEERADITAFGELRLQFLSTQGHGRIKLSAVDSKGTIIAESGQVFTGDIPQSSVNNRWQDEKYKTNYQGGWLERKYDITQMFAGFTPELLASASSYRLSVEVGQGQHVLVTKFALGFDRTKAVRLVPRTLNYTVNQGELVTIDADVQNLSKEVVDKVTVKILEPYGYGLVTRGAVTQNIEQLVPGESRHISFEVQANRPNAVNLNKPWPLKFSIDEREVELQVQVAVADQRPGSVFYVMTEDLEPIDGAGYAKAWGNSNSWLEPQEFLGQMVHKSEALNQIAEKHGAKWTHYIAWPAVKAAQWADKQSSTGEWSKVVKTIQESVTKEAERGHEYGIHFHTDYDPYLSDNVLSYNGAVDGIWANHLKHGWAHSITAEGDFGDYNSRTGILYEYQRILDQLVSSSGQGQILTARAGSFDFGDGSVDEAMSTRAYKKVGLWGASDADGNTGKAITTGEFGSEIYFGATDDINAAAQELTNVGIVEFRPTPREAIGYDSQSAKIMNDKTNQGMRFFTGENGNIKPGVHAIVGFTHAMFVMGQGDWQSTTGGQFQVFDNHLGYVKQQYVDKGTLKFATASKLIEEYLDYYTPQLLAIYGERLSDKQGIAEYGLRILGKDILVDADYSHAVSVKYPLYLRESAYRISILKNGETIYNTWDLPTPYNDIYFIVNDKQAIYTMKIYHNELITAIIAQLKIIKAKVS